MGDQRDVKPGSILSRFVVLRRKILDTRKISSNAPFLPAPPNLLVKASHSSLEKLICSQKSPGGYPTVIPALQKHPAKRLTRGGTVAQTANPFIQKRSAVRSGSRLPRLSRHPSAGQHGGAAGKRLLAAAATPLLYRREGEGLL